MRKSVAKELEEIMSCDTPEDIAMNKRLDELEQEPIQDGIEIADISPRERLENIFTKEFIATLDDEEVNVQIAIMDEAEEAVINIEKQDTVAEAVESPINDSLINPVENMVATVIEPIKRGRGRPKGSKNKVKIAPELGVKDMYSNT